MFMGTREPQTQLTLRAVVVDDEPLAREYLKLLISRVGGVDVVAECGEAAECLRHVTEFAPDVVFLDIHLPDESGMDVARALRGLVDPPQIVFVTGYDDYAVPAFEVEATDYVMKPLCQERLARTLDRVRARVTEAGLKLSGGNGNALLSMGRLPIRTPDGYKLVDARDICYIHTSNRKTSIHTVSDTHLTQYTLAELEQKLTAHRFFRANEGCLVNLDRVKEIIYYGPRTYELLLSEPKDTLIPLSRSRAQDLREMLDL